MDSRILNDWIALIIRILDGSILPVHEPERQTMNGVDGRAVIGNRCENPHLVEEVDYFLCRLVKMNQRSINRSSNVIDWLTILACSPLAIPIVVTITSWMDTSLTRYDLPMRLRP